MYSSKRYPWLLLGDTACLIFSFFWVTFWRRFYDLSWPLILDHAILFGLLIVLWLWIFHLSGFYEVRYYRHIPSTILFTGVIISFLFSTVILYFISGLYDKIPTPKTILMLASALAWILLYFWRSRASNLFGLKDTSREAGELSSVIGGEFLVLDRRVLLNEASNGYHEVLRDAGLRGIPVLTKSAAESIKTGRVPIEEIGALWVVDKVLEFNFSNRLYYIAKRAMDVAVALVVFPVALISGMFLALWIAFFVGWPIFYSQKRIGSGKKAFTIWKFRTMTHHSAAVSGTNGHGISADSHGRLTQVKDPRIPKTVRWIRKLHLDEVPQLLNILKGDMSWVGPRPEQIAVTEELESVIPYYWVRHTTPPGLTGWAQVNMGYAGNMDKAKERFSYDLYYLANRSVTLDASILFRTLRNILIADGR